MPSSTNTIQTHQFNWNAWVAWMCKMKCYENLNNEVFGIWESHWDERVQVFYSGSISCAYEDCPETYAAWLVNWEGNLNRDVIPKIQAHNFVSSCSVQNNVYVKGSRRYELINHLGNVLAVVSDRKIELDEDYFYAGMGSSYRYENGSYLEDPNGEYRQNSGPDGIIHSYSAEVISANDYYAFGSLMPGRSFSGWEYRYGFNGKEIDVEVSGSGNQYDYGFRIYNPRLCKFLSIDPLTKSYPWYSPYQFAGNKPIIAIDLDGLEEKIAITPQGEQTALIIRAQSEWIYRAIQASTNTNFNQVYKYSITPSKLTKADEEFYGYRSLIGRVRGAYVEGVFGYNLSQDFHALGFTLQNNGVIRLSNVDIVPGDSYFIFQDRGFDITVSLKLGFTNRGNNPKYHSLFAFFREADGGYDAELYFIGTKTFGYEVKTYNPKNTIINIVAYEQAVNQIIVNYAKAQLTSDGQFIPVLVTDEAAWMNAYNANPDKMQAIYDKLSAIGGKLQLEQGLFDGANKQMNATKRQVIESGL